MAYNNTHTYRLLATLNGQHSDTVTCIQFSPCGEYLITGGDDLRMNVFDCSNNFKNILSVDSTSPASAICWNPNKPKSCFVGYSGGAVVSHTFGNDLEEWAAEILLFNGRCRVIALAWDKMLAVATERNVFLIKDIKASTDGQRGVIDTQHGAITISPPATNYGQPEPRSVCFTLDGSLVIAYLEHGVVCWSPDGKTLKWSFTPRALRIGRFSYSPTSDLFVVHNLYDGFDAYMMKSRAHFRSYRFPVSEEDNVPLSCILINDGRHIVCGTTFGKAVVLDAMTLAHQADLTHCHFGLVQDIAYCNKNGANILATTASEKGRETSIKIWAADVVSCQSISYADRITEVFRSTINLFGDLCARVVRWRSQTVELSVLSLLLWVLVLLVAAVSLSYLNTSVLEGFGRSLRSACRSSWAVSKEAFLKNGRTLQKALKFGLRACYLFLKGVMISVYEFLEEQPHPPADTTDLTPAESPVARGSSMRFEDVLGGQGARTMLGNGPMTDGIPEKLHAHPLHRVIVPVEADNTLDWAVSVSFLRVEDDAPTTDAPPGSDETPAVDNTPGVGDASVKDNKPGVDNLPAVGGISTELSSRRVTTDIQVHAGWLP